LAPYSRLSHGRSLTRFFFASIVHSGEVECQLGGVSIVGIVLGARVDALVWEMHFEEESVDGSFEVGVWRDGFQGSSRSLGGLLFGWHLCRSVL